MGDASDLGAALAEAVSAQADRESQAGVLVVSDGRATSPGAKDAARLALARSVPVWTWCLGGDVPRRDLWIEAPSREVLAFAASEVDLHACLRQTGYPNRSFKVEVLREGTVVDSQELLPDVLVLHAALGDLSMATDNEIFSKKYRFWGTREQVKLNTAMMALDWVRRYLNGDSFLPGL